MNTKAVRADEIEVGMRLWGGGTVVAVHRWETGSVSVLWDWPELPRSYRGDHLLMFVIPEPPHPAVQALAEFEAWVAGPGLISVSERGIAKLRELRAKHNV